MLAKRNESKDVMIFFVYNKIDEFCTKLLTKEDKYDSDKSQSQLFVENKEFLNAEITKNFNDIFQNIKDLIVFGSLASEIKRFNCKDLKDYKYVDYLVQSSIYLITSKCDKFEDEFQSRDGIRLRAEITHHLPNVKNANIDLTDKFCKRTIFYKKKVILNELFSSFDAKKRLVIGGILSVVPFLDIPYTNRTQKIFKNKFLDLFGIKTIMSKMASGELSLDQDRMTKLKILLDKIKNDKVIDQIDDLFENVSGISMSNLKEQVTRLISVIMPALGVTVGSVTDDILTKLGTAAVGISSVVSKGLFIAFAVLSVPASMGIYVLIIMSITKKILRRYEEYSLIIAEILHPTDRFQISLVRTKNRLLSIELNTFTH